MGSGVRVPLRFMPNFKVRGGPKEQGNISLFPGAIVALKGRNGGGGWFSVSEVMTVRFPRQFRLYLCLIYLQLPPLLPPTSSVLRDEAFKQESRETPFSVTIACGPFTPDSDLLFKPWSSLLKNLLISKPSVVLLVCAVFGVQAHLLMLLLDWTILRLEQRKAQDW